MQLTSRRFLRTLGPCLLIAFVASSCGVNRSYVGESTWETKSNILRKSPIYATSEALYPYDKVAPSFPSTSPSRAQVVALQQLLQDLLEQLCQQHNVRRRTLSVYYEAPLPPCPNLRVVLTNAGAPIIHTEIDGTLAIDIRVLHALFQSTLVTALPASWRVGDQAQMWSLRGFSTTSDYDVVSDTSIARAVTQFLELRAAVRSTPGLPAALDTAISVATLDILRDPKLNTYADIVAQLDEGFMGALLFLLAHEVGHHVLRHFSHPLSNLDQDRFAEYELSADIYAVSVLGDAWGAENAFGLQKVVTHNMRGHALYFNLAERLVGFRDGPARHGLTYPKASRRLSVTTYWYEKVRQQRLKELDNRSRRPSR